MTFVSAVKKRFKHADERVGAVLDKVGPKYGKIGTVLGVMGIFAALFVGNASAITVNPNAIYGGLSIIDIVLMALGGIGFIAALYLRDFRVMIVAIILLVLAAVGYYIGV
jgi:hypothetical protein